MSRVTTESVRALSEMLRGARGDVGAVTSCDDLAAGYLEAADDLLDAREESDAQRTRADAADCAAEGLRRELAAAQGECARLRAIVDHLATYFEVPVGGVVGAVNDLARSEGQLRADHGCAMAGLDHLRAELARALAVIAAVRVERAAVASWADVPTLETLRAVRRSETATDAALARVTP